MLKFLVNNFDDLKWWIVVLKNVYVLMLKWRFEYVVVFFLLVDYLYDVVNVCFN